jgi:hypothetical protein
MCAVPFYVPGRVLVVPAGLGGFAGFFAGTHVAGWILARYALGGQSRIFFHCVSHA